MTRTAYLLRPDAGIAIGDGPRKPIQYVGLRAAGVPPALVVRHIQRRLCCIVLLPCCLICCRVCTIKKR